MHFVHGSSPPASRPAIFAVDLTLHTEAPVVRDWSHDLRDSAHLAVHVLKVGKTITWYKSTLVFSASYIRVCGQVVSRKMYRLHGASQCKSGQRAEIKVTA